MPELPRLRRHDASTRRFTRRVVSPRSRDQRGAIFTEHDDDREKVPLAFPHASAAQLLECSMPSIYDFSHSRRRRMLD